MARRKGDGLYLRGHSWYLDCYIRGQRVPRCLGAHIKREHASELAAAYRAEVLKGTAGIGKKPAPKDISFDEARPAFEQWLKPIGNRRP
jgi:hypothetical protein